MTDRVYALSVALEHDIRTDDVQPLIDAIKTLRGVVAVEMHISDISEWAAREVARQELAEKLWNILYPKQEKGR